MIFENSNALWFIIIVPLLLFGIGYLGWTGKKEIAGIFQLDLQRFRREQVEKYFTAGLLLVLLLTALALPKLSLPGTEIIERTGEVLFLVDVSGSMGAQKDHEHPGRLERTKPMILHLIDELEKSGEVRVALYGFTGIARSHVPFVGVDDYPYLKESVQNLLGIYSTPGHGTSLARPVLNVIGKFSEETSAKLIVIFSDGEVFISDRPGMHEVEREWIEEAVTKTNKHGIRVITVGVGELEGAKIGIENSKGNPTGDYVSFGGMDYVTYLKEETLIELAARTGGEYFTEEHQEELLDYLEKNLLTNTQVVTTEDSFQYKSVSQWLILIAIPVWALAARRYLLR